MTPLCVSNMSLEAKTSRFDLSHLGRDYSLRLGDLEVEQPEDKVEKNQNGRERDGVGGEEGRR